MDIAHGIEISPYMGGGEGSIFYPHQYKNHPQFIEALEKCFYDLEEGQFSKYPQNCPCGTITIEFVDGWSFLYRMDHYGNWESVCFTYGLPKVTYPAQLLDI